MFFMYVKITMLNIKIEQGSAPHPPPIFVVVDGMCSECGIPREAQRIL